MRQSIFSAIPGILMEAFGIDFVTGGNQEILFSRCWGAGGGCLVLDGVMERTGDLWDGLSQRGLEAGLSSGRSWVLAWLALPKGEPPCPHWG